MIDLGPILGLIMLIVGWIAFYPCLRFWRQQRQLHWQGITVPGQVIERHQERGWNGHPWYYITCCYTFEGQSYLCDYPVWHTLYECEEPSVSVRFLPDKPELATIPGDDFLRSLWAQRTIPGSLFMLIGIEMLCSFLPALLAGHR